MSGQRSSLRVSSAEPAYSQIKRYIVERIGSGALKEGDRVPSEAELLRKFRVSRMTAHRALRELTTEKVVHRVQGLGTFVAEPKHATTLVAIRSISDEIKERGHSHACRVLELGRMRLADSAIALPLPPSTLLFHSVLLHLEDGVPLQIEDRVVNAAAAPDYLKQDFTRITPNQYLTRIEPLPRAEYAIEAIAADRRIARLLAIPAGSACLVLTRMTWSKGVPVTNARLTYPGERHRFTGRL
jgi:GntR family histidine utilization transcriptional repressor